MRLQEEKNYVTVTEVSVSVERGFFYKITAKGTVPTTGWTVNLHPVVYVTEPENWLIEAVGIPPSGAAGQMVTEWEATAQLQLGKKTNSVTVQGKNKVTQNVPALAAK